MGKMNSDYSQSKCKTQSPTSGDNQTEKDKKFWIGVSKCIYMRDRFPIKQVTEMLCDFHARNYTIEPMCLKTTLTKKERKK